MPTDQDGQGQSLSPKTQGFPPGRRLSGARAGVVKRALGEAADGTEPAFCSVAPQTGLGSKLTFTTPMPPAKMVSHKLKKILVIQCFPTQGSGGVPAKWCS